MIATLSEKRGTTTGNGGRQQREGTAAAAMASASSAMRCVSTGDANLRRLASTIATKVGPQRFNTWFDTSTRLGFRNDHLEICVPNEFIRDWINQRFASTIQDAAVEVFGSTLPLQFNVFPDAFDGAEEAPVAHASPATAAPAAIPVAQAQVARPAHRNAPPKLRHNLSNYVVGPSNQLAHNAALHVAEFPGTQYNPLFIHGSCGLGKTHLLQGLCQKFVEHHPSRKYLYVTGEEFTNEYLLALRTNKVENFRRRMRDLDLLVIDDVHFLAGKKATQEEFLHTFNAIEALGKQVVMASDAHPKEIAEFGESLVNRFVSGMVVRVDPPNLQMRCEILRRLAAAQRMVLSEETIAWVARRVTQNVREIEGAVTRICAHVMLTHQNPTVELAQQALGDLERAMVAPVKPENVLRAVAEHFGLDDKDIMSGRRHHTVSLARSVAMYLIRKTAKLSYPEIGQRLGNRNHSTVISACRRIDAAIAGNEKLVWSGPLGERTDEAAELVQRLEDQARSMG